MSCWPMSCCLSSLEHTSQAVSDLAVSAISRRRDCFYFMIAQRLAIVFCPLFRILTQSLLILQMLTRLVDLSRGGRTASHCLYAVYSPAPYPQCSLLFRTYIY